MAVLVRIGVDEYSTIFHNFAEGFALDFMDGFGALTGGHGEFVGLVGPKS